jgi:hypothetical protein
MIGGLSKNMNDLKLFSPAPEGAPLYIPSKTATQKVPPSPYSSWSQPKENVWVLKEDYRLGQKDEVKQLKMHQCSLQELLEPKIAYLETQAKHMNLTNV